MTRTRQGLEITDPAAYRQKSLDLLGDRDAIEVMSGTVDVLAEIVGKHSVAHMRTRPFAGKWTPNEVIGHLVDAEWVLGFRLRVILAEENPDILGMDQELWVARQRYNDRAPGDLVRDFRSLRGINLPLWSGLSPADLKRSGNHNERGPESLDTMLRMYAAHDLHHVDQINRYLQAAAGPAWQ